MEERLRAGIGTSEAASAEEAGRTAAAAALARLDGRRPALVIVYASISYDLPALLTAIRSVTGSAPLVGSTSCGQLHEGTFVPVGRGVEVLALTAGPYRFGVSHVEALGSGDAEVAGRKLVTAAREAAGRAPSPHAAVLLLQVGLAGNQQPLLNGIYKVAGAAVPVVGGNASDDRLFGETFVFHGGEVLRDAAVAVWIGSPAPLNVVARHGWSPIGLPLLVTRAEGLVVHEIGGRPALDVYAEAVHDDDLRRQVPGSYSTPAAAHPFGVIEADGTYLIRAAIPGTDGDVTTLTPVLEYSAINVMTGQPDDLLGVSEPLVRAALAGRDATVLLVFTCAGRQDILLERTAEEAALIQRAAGDVPTFGYYTYGEFARSKSVAGYHNATIAALAL